MGGPVEAGVSDRTYSERKTAFKTNLEELLDTYSRVLVVDADNVGSQQMHMIRRALRGKAQIVMGKNTLIRFIIDNHAKNTGNQKLQGLSALCRLNVGLVFTNDDLKEVRDILEANRVEAPARVGALAPKTVYVPAGPTGLEPTQTSFFQALSVPTKINKGSIEILSEVTLIIEGEKCGASQVALLNKLNIRPFTYGLSVCKIWDNGSVYPPTVLDITNEDITSAIQSGITAIASISLATGFPTAAAVPHLIVQGMKNVFAVALATEYSFPEADKLKEMLANPGAFAAAAPAGGAAEAKAPEPEPEEEEDDDGDMGFGGLF